MRTLFGLFGLTAFMIACGSAPRKKTDTLDEAAATCCCKIMPKTAEKEIIPTYSQTGRMECSSNQGECVDDVQCNNAGDQAAQPSNDGVPPPPTLEPSTSTMPE